MQIPPVSVDAKSVFTDVMYVIQTKELATRYERALQESQSTTEKAKSRFDMTAEELERLLLQKEGESLKDNAMQSRSPVNGKRVIGKAVAKGGMLLKGKNPQNVRISLLMLCSRYRNQTRSNDKKTTSEHVCPARRTRTTKLLRTHKLSDRSTLISNCRESSEYVHVFSSLFGILQRPPAD